MDNYQITCFMNKETFSAEEIKKYPYDKRKSYVFTIRFDGEHFDDECYATDDESAKQFIGSKYNGELCGLSEAITTFREII